MEKTYEPDQIEQRWYKHWEDNAYFSPSGGGEPYSILIPPPNVTGTLHMGHAFQHTLQDALIRYHRMQGHDTLWEPGTDHAGIATQMVVERQLEAEGKSRHDLGREKFVEKVWEWKKYSGDTITRQMRRLGDSTDWNREWFTMDPEISNAVLEVFEKLFDEDIIYRGKRLVNWDPVLHTALSDLEVENREVPGHMWHFKYPLAGGETYEYIECDADGNVTLRETRDYISIATTRPETMLGDGAVAVHPSDARYAPIVGKLCEIPVGPKALRRLVPIITDNYPDPDFGSGAVKITGAHDFNDYAVAARNNIPMYALMDAAARMRTDGLPYEESARIAGQIARGEIPPDDVSAVNLVPEELRGLDRFEARARVVEAITAEGLAVTDADGNPLVDSKSIMQPFGDRSGTVVEPYLTDQWYMQMEPLAKPAIKAVEDGDITFVPGNWSKTYFNWMHDIQDWCISRQLWWGHRIPAWYDDNGNIYVGRDEAHVREKYSLGNATELRQDEDVLDTWFSAALLPFATFGWPPEDGKSTEDLEKYLPTNVLVTGFDIIFFWVARMIMMTLKFTDKAPFREIYITGLIRDENGQKMSKSKGNIIDPIDLIDGIDIDELVKKRTFGLMQPQMRDKVEKATRKSFPEGIRPYGTDALRFTLTALASPSRDINFDMGRLEGYRNFCNKIWNAARYVTMNTEDEDCGVSSASGGGEMEFSAADRWIRSRLKKTIAEIEKQTKVYRFDLIANAIHDFTWGDFCDWYLELSKPVLMSDDSSDEQKRGTRNTLVTVLEALLRVMHPYMPFISEEIWQRVAPLAGIEGASIMLQPYPQATDYEADAAAEAEMRWAMEFILGIRRIRGEMDISPSKPLPVLLENMSDDDRQLFQRQERLLKFLARIDDITVLKTGDDIPQTAVALLGNMRIHVPMAGLIDKDAELARLDRQIEKTEKNLKGGKKKLSNDSFVSNAPEAVVAKERERVAEMEGVLKELKGQRERIASL